MITAQRNNIVGISFNKNKTYFNQMVDKEKVALITGAVTFLVDWLNMKKSKSRICQNISKKTR